MSIFNILRKPWFTHKELRLCRATFLPDLCQMNYNINLLFFLTNLRLDIRNVIIWSWFSCIMYRQSPDIIVYVNNDQFIPVEQEVNGTVILSRTRGFVFHEKNCVRLGLFEHEVSKAKKVCLIANIKPNRATLKCFTILYQICNLILTKLL